MLRDDVGIVPYETKRQCRFGMPRRERVWKCGKWAAGAGESIAIFAQNVQKSQETCYIMAQITRILLQMSHKSGNIKVYSIRAATERRPDRAGSQRKENHHEREVPSTLASSLGQA